MISKICLTLLIEQDDAIVTSPSILQKVGLERDAKNRKEKDELQKNKKREVNKKDADSLEIYLCKIYKEKWKTIWETRLPY